MNTPVLLGTYVPYMVMDTPTQVQLVLNMYVCSTRVASFLATASIHRFQYEIRWGKAWEICHVQCYQVDTW